MTPLEDIMSDGAKASRSAANTVDLKESLGELVEAYAAASSKLERHGGSASDRRTLREGMVWMYAHTREVSA